jgi:hypothetical protein
VQDLGLIGLLQHVQLLPFAMPFISIPGSTLGNRNMAGEAVAMAIPFGVAVIATPRRGRARLAAGIALLLAELMFLAVTRARGAWIGGALGVVMFFVVRRPALPRKALLLSIPVVAVGAAGAVTLKKRQYSSVGTTTSPTYSLGNAATSGVGYAIGDGQGVRSVTRNSAGNWTFTLSDPYAYLVGVEVALISNASGAVTSPLCPIAIVSGSTNVATNTSVGSGGTIRLILMASDGQTATDPADGDTLTFHFVLGTTSAL